MLKKLPTFLLLSLLTGCTALEYSPNQAFDKSTPVNINAHNLARIQNAAHDDTIRFVLSGDTQRAYNEYEGFVDAVNKMKGIDFVIIAGDISDFGLLQEMKWVHRLYAQLKVPYLGVIGNHDLQGRGKEVFERMYGSLNYSFVYDGVKFICHDTNSREHNFNGKVPDLEWIENELKPAPDIRGYIAIGHVPPFATDFDKSLENKYISLLTSPDMYASLYAHVNNAEVHYYNEGESGYTDDPVSNIQGNKPFISTNAIQNRAFMLVEIINGKFYKKDIRY